MASNISKNVTHGSWGGWSNWTICTKECGGGRQRRLRQCNSPAPKNGGRPCMGSVFEDKSCNSQACRKYIMLNCLFFVCLFFLFCFL